MTENLVEDRMLAELDVLVFLKSHDSLEHVAERVFGVLHSQYSPTDPEESNGETYFQASGLGFQATLFPNAGDVQDPEFPDYQFGLEISSTFWCVELDTVDLEGPLSEYFARKIAFDLDIETATEMLLETTEESDIFEIRAYRRNPQFRFDQAPTVPKVFVIESRQVEESFDSEELEEDFDEDEDDLDEYADEEELTADLEAEDRV